MISDVTDLINDSGGGSGEAGNWAEADLARFSVDNVGALARNKDAGCRAAWWSFGIGVNGADSQGRNIQFCITAVISQHCRRLGGVIRTS